MVADVSVTQLHLCYRTQPSMKVFSFFPKRNGASNVGLSAEEVFFLAQSVQVVKNSEEYYRYTIKINFYFIFMLCLLLVPSSL